MSDIDEDIDLSGTLRVLWRRRGIVIACTVIGAIVALASVQLRPRVYEATAEVLIEDDSSTSVLDPQRSVASEAKQRVATEIDVIGSRVVSVRASQALGWTPSVTARAKESSSVVEVVAEGETRERAQLAADAVSDAYVEFRRERTLRELNTAVLSLVERRNELDDALAGAQAAAAVAQEAAAAAPDDPAAALSAAQAQDALAAARQSSELEGAVLAEQVSQLQAASVLAVRQGPSVVSKALADPAPASPRPLRDVVLGVLVGFAFGCGLALVRDRLDDTVRTLEEVEALGVVVLGSIPTIDAGAAEGWVVTMDAPRSIAAEAFRALRVGIELAAVDRRVGRLLVTSPAAQEGKSTVAANLAVAVSGAGESVTLVDADLRRPRQDRNFGIAAVPGLTNLVVGAAAVDEVAHEIAGAPRLSVVPAGTTPPNAAELLGTASTRRSLQALADGRDLLLIDAPPVLAVADALVLSAMSDAVVVVVALGSTSRRELRRTLDQIERTSAVLLGAVVNRSSTSDAGAYAYTQDRNRLRRTLRRTPAAHGDPIGGEVG